MVKTFTSASIDPVDSCERVSGLTQCWVRHKGKKETAPAGITHQRNVPCPLWMGVQSALSSWAACTSCGEWGDSLQQELAPPASAAHRQEPTAWSPSSQASDVTHKELEAKAQEEKLDLLKSRGEVVLNLLRHAQIYVKVPYFLSFFKS